MKEVSRCRIGGKEVAGWEGGCGKFVLIQSGGGDCFHRYIGGITALPSHLSPAAKQATRPPNCDKGAPTQGQGQGQEVCWSLESW